MAAQFHMVAVRFHVEKRLQVLRLRLIWTVGVTNEPQSRSIATALSDKTFPILPSSW